MEESTPLSATQGEDSQGHVGEEKQGLADKQEEEEEEELMEGHTIVTRTGRSGIGWDSWVSCEDAGVPGISSDMH